MSDGARAGDGQDLPYVPGPPAAEPEPAPAPHQQDPLRVFQISAGSFLSLVSAVRHNKYLRKLAAFVCPRRQRSSARFITDLAAVTSIITTVACDILFLTFSNRSLQEVQRRHGPALQALELLYQLVDNPSVLAELGYSAEQTTTAVVFFGMFIGAQGLQPHPPDDWRLRDEAAALRGPRDEAPFTVQLMFLLLSRQLSLLALAECITRARFGFWSEDRRSFYPDPLPQAVFGVRWGMVTASVRELGRVVVSFTGASIDAIRFEEAWPAARFRAGRHFMDACFQLPFAEGSTTVFQTTAASDGLYWAKPHWFRYFGNDVSGELEAILDGTFCVAKNGLPLKPIFQKNHPSYLNNPVAQEILIKIVTGWFDSGVLEYVCRWHRLPQCILACGAVDKNSAPWFRMITDARAINVYAVSWRVKYITISDLCLMLMPRSLMTVRDLKAAYHLIRYGGCNGLANFIMRWVTNHAKTGYEAKRFMRAGCGPGDCTGWCDKSLMAICVEGHVGRFACAQFGHKVSNTGLSIVTDAVVLYASRNLEIDSGAFVDDFLNALRVAAHAACAGLAQGCAVCTAAAAEAQGVFDALDQMMTDCALVFSTKGDMSVAQRHVFLGVIIDTHVGRLYVTEEKFEKLMTLLREVMGLLTCSSRNMARLRGKAQHQFRCIEGVRPFLVRLDRFIGGPESVYAWDLERDITPQLRHTMGFLYQQLPGLRAAGAEMWPLAPATLYHRWLQGTTPPGTRVIVATWDASVKGVAICIALEPGSTFRLEGMRFQGVSTIITFEDTPEAQVHREAAGAPMVMRLLKRVVDVRDATIILRNDCEPVVLALRKGSPSPQLQEAAETVCSEALDGGCRVLTLHVPGVQLIAEGIDGGSREGAERLLGPRCSAATRTTLAAFLSGHGWELTLDLFASTSNAMTPRFVSWTDEPDSEAVDAFNLRSWAQTRCGCGEYHRETLFIFPPRGLERLAVHRARSDSVRACFMVPTNHRAAYWKLLRTVSTARLAFNDPKRDFELALAPLAAHTAFLVDFGEADVSRPGCGQERSRRGRLPRWEPSELAVFTDLQNIVREIDNAP